MDESQKDFLRQKSGVLSDAEIAEILGCSLVTVRRQKRQLKIPRLNKVWDKVMCQKFVECVKREADCDTVAEKMNMSVENVRRRIYLLQKKGMDVPLPPSQNVGKGRNCHLSEDEKEYIRDNAEKMSDFEIAQWIGCTKYAVNFYKRKNGLKNKRKVWDLTMYERLSEYVKKGVSYKEIAKHFGMTNQNIAQRVHIMRKKGVLN